MLTLGYQNTALGSQNLLNLQRGFVRVLCLPQ